MDCNRVSLSVELLGDGRLPALVVDTPEVDFGTVEVGATSLTVAVKLRNRGPDSVTLSYAGGATSSPQFIGGQSCQGSTLESGGTCNLSFSFTPDARGTFPGLGCGLALCRAQESVFADRLE